MLWKHPRTTLLIIVWNIIGTSIHLLKLFHFLTQCYAISLVHVCIQLFYFSDLKLRIKSFKNGLLMRWKIQHVSLKCLSYSTHPYPVYRIYNQKQFPIIALFLFDEPKIFSLRCIGGEIESTYFQNHVFV